MSDQQQPLLGVARDDTKPQQPQDNPSSSHQPLVVEVKGVRLKHFERVLIKLLPHVEPRYIPLPSPRPPMCDKSSIWDTLPPAARVHGSLPGQLSHRERATRKEDQLTSMMRCIFAMMDNTTNKKENSTTIVDFGGGSGHLSIPLALLLPHCKIVVVDLKQKSLDFLQEKARACAQQTQTKDNSDNVSDNNPPHHPRQENMDQHILPTAIPNLFTFAGDVESYFETFDIGVALHVCGEATDVVIRKCAFHKAHMVVAPCCVGKLNRQVKDPYIYRATSHNTPTIQYPQSKRFQQCLPTSTVTALQVNDNHNTPSYDATAANKNSKTNNHRTDMNDWDALAKAADYNQELDLLLMNNNNNNSNNNNNNNNHRRNAARRTAKGLLELDRQLYLQESYPAYQTALTRMQPLTASPKHDILMGYHHTNCNNDGGCDDETQKWWSDQDAQLEDPVFAWTKAHLLHPGASGESDTVTKNGTSTVASSGSSLGIHLKQVVPDVATQSNRHGSSTGSTHSNAKADGVDWTWAEEQEIRMQLITHFPPGEGSTPLPSSSLKVADASISKGRPGQSSDDHHENKPQSSNTATDGTFVFPPGMGGRKRKIIHFVAEELGLAHWCVGKKHAEKTVAVRRKYVNGKCR